MREQNKRLIKHCADAARKCDTQNIKNPLQTNKIPHRKCPEIDVKLISQKANIQ